MNNNTDKFTFRLLLNLFNPKTNDWEKEIGDKLELGDIYPPLVQSHSYVGNVTEIVKKELKSRVPCHR
mgnify:CR=1 FL=1